MPANNRWHKSEVSVASFRRNLTSQGVRNQDEDLIITGQGGKTALCACSVYLRTESNTE